jgi:hypothetical protein
MKPVELRTGILAWMRRRLLAGGLLGHNGESIETYCENSWFLAPFPAAKSIPYVADNLATNNISSFRFDPEFRRASSVALGRWQGVENPRDVSWRLHVAIFAARLGLSGADAGDCAIELGTGRGFMAAGIFEALGSNFFDRGGVSFFLMDSFRPEWQGENAIARKNGQNLRTEGGEPLVLRRWACRGYGLFLEVSAGSCGRRNTP